MINFLISLALAVGAYAGVERLYPGWPAILAGVLAGAVSYFFLARRSNRQLEARMRDVEAALGAQQPDEALQILEDARSLSRWQFLVSTMIDGQVGTILYAHKQRLEEAKPYLEKAIVKNWYAKLMLAALHFKRREYEDMVRVFEDTVKNNKEAPLAWATYAWCEAKRGKRAEAIAVLERGLKELPNEDRLKRNLIALQNKKRLSMKAFTPDWWVLHLERPPGQVMAGGRMNVPRGAKMKMKKMR